MAGGNDTMPIRIPGTMNAEQLDDDTAQAISAFGRLRAAMRSIRADRSLAGKSFEELRRNEEQLTATKDRLTKKLEDLKKAYAETDPAVEGNSERLSRMAATISRTEKEIVRMDEALRQVKLAEYAQEADALSEQIDALEKSTEREIATLRIQGREVEASQLAERNAARIKQLYADRVKAIGAAVEKATRTEGDNSKTVQDLARSTTSPPTR
jgi:septal ring factor EnvC (AmiA/AmiB activator)